MSPDLTIDTTHTGGPGLNITRENKHVHILSCNVYFVATRLSTYPGATPQGVTTSPSTTVGSLARASSPSSRISRSPTVWNCSTPRSFCLE